MNTAITIPEDSFPLGAHLTSPRRGFVHHGIYAGNGRVIQYAGFFNPFRWSVIEEVSLERFHRGRGLRLHVCAVPQFEGAAVVKRARSRLGERRYSVLSNNCEHFIEWCISGRARSRQVERWLGVLPGLFLRVRQAIWNTASVEGAEHARA